MNRLAQHLALHVARHPAATPFAIGALLGAAAGLMLRVGIGGVPGLVMALLLVASGTASALCLQIHRRPLPAGPARRQAVRAWGVAIGLGIAAALCLVDVAMAG